jgi:hypothetical protein
MKMDYKVDENKCQNFKLELFSALGVTMKPTTVLSLPLEVLLCFVAVHPVAQHTSIS